MAQEAFGQSAQLVVRHVEEAQLRRPVPRVAVQLRQFVLVQAQHLFQTDKSNGVESGLDGSDIVAEEDGIGRAPAVGWC